MSACSVSSVDLRPVQIYNRARSTCEVAGRLTWVEMFSVGAGTNWSAHSDFQHAQANAIWLGLEFRIKLFIKAQVSVGASICSAELTTVIVAVISSCSSSNYSLERHKCDCFYFQQRIFHHVLCFVKPSVLYCLNERTESLRENTVELHIWSWLRSLL